MRGSNKWHSAKQTDCEYILTVLKSYFYCLIQNRVMWRPRCPDGRLAPEMRWGGPLETCHRAGAFLLVRLHVFVYYKTKDMIIIPSLWCMKT